MSIGLLGAFGPTISALLAAISNQIFLCSILHLTSFELHFD
jgi:hypothetical protein